CTSMINPTSSVVVATIRRNPDNMSRTIGVPRFTDDDVLQRLPARLPAFRHLHASQPPSGQQVGKILQGSLSAPHSLRRSLHQTRADRRFRTDSHPHPPGHAPSASTLEASLSPVHKGHRATDQKNAWSPEPGWGRKYARSAPNT